MSLLECNIPIFGYHNIRSNMMIGPNVKKMPNILSQKFKKPKIIMPNFQKAKHEIFGLLKAEKLIRPKAHYAENNKAEK